MTPRLDLVGFVVTDMARTLDFYRRLGLDIPASADVEAHVEHVLPGGLRLAWDTTEVVLSFEPGWTTPSGGHRMAPAFRCDSPAEVDATFAAMVAAGFAGHREPWDAFWGQRYATVLDPDGNTVDLFADLAAAEPA